MSKQNLNNTKHLKSQPHWSLKQPKIKTSSNLVNGRSKPHVIGQESKVRSIKKGDTSRPQVEDFIKNIFRKHHGAELTHFAPSLLAIFNQENEVDAALGFRLAREEPLFLELYLDQSIESLVSNYIGKNIERNSIGETGNLASSDAKSCKTLFAYTADYLHQQGIEWFVSTGTGVMRVVYRRLGIKAHIIHNVEKSRLGNEQHSWGSFYEDKPKIILINVAQARQRFMELKAQTNNSH